jgi:ATP-dependent RNA helicase RhlE
MTFHDLNLNKPLLKALDDMELVQPTPIQIEAFSTIMSGRDVIGVAQTGTGKTYAYLLPLLRLHKYSKEKHPRVLIIVPTRELVIQVVEEIEKLAAYISVRVVGVYGGTNMNTQRAVVEEGVDFLVATPGRLYDLAMSRSLRLKFVKKLVIDEVDTMLDLGFRPQLNNILDLLPEKRQNLLFSATMTEEVEKIIESYFNDPQKIEVDLTGTPVEKIDQSGYTVPNFNTKTSLLKHLLQQNESMVKVLVFVSTKRFADLLFEQLEPTYKESLGIIHSNKAQNFRINTVRAFHAGEIRVLIATEIIARGLDVSEVSHVINFDSPEIPENYIHRIGRTGRADRRGNAITFFKEEENEIKASIEALMKREIPILPLPEEIVISEELVPEEIPASAGDINYLPTINLSSEGAFHEKSDKNKKVNQAHLKRKARLLEKKKAKRKKKQKGKK